VNTCRYCTCEILKHKYKNLKKAVSKYHPVLEISYFFMEFLMFSPSVAVLHPSTQFTCKLRHHP